MFKVIRYQIAALRFNWSLALPGTVLGRFFGVLRTCPLLVLLCAVAANDVAGSGHCASVNLGISAFLPGEVVFYDPAFGRLILSDALPIIGCSHIGSCTAPFGTTRDEVCLADAPFGIVTFDAECGQDLADDPGAAYLSRKVSVKVRPHMTPGSPLGHITFAIGGNGVAFYEDAIADPNVCLPDEFCDDAGDAIAELMLAGYRTYQVSHKQFVPEGEEDLGRFTGGQGQGIREISCTYALVVKWIDSRKNLAEALCSTGNSGGSYEIAYGLAYYDLDAALDAAVMTGGPAHRWDLHAFAGAECDPLEDCPPPIEAPCGEAGNPCPTGILEPPCGFVPAPGATNGLLCWNTAFGCGSVDYFVNGNSRIDCDYPDPDHPGEVPGPACRFRKPPHDDLPPCCYVAAIKSSPSMSILPGLADLVYPSTKIRFVVAENDPTNWQNFILLYKNDIKLAADRIRGAEIGEVVIDGQPYDFSEVHTIPTTRPGSDQVRDYLLETCHVNSSVAALAPDKDNTLYMDRDGLLSNGAGQHFFAGQGDGIQRRAVISFDVAGNLPAGSTITGAALTLNLSSNLSDASTVSLHRVLSDWGEGTSDAAGTEVNGAPSTPGDATWKHTSYDTDLWTELGGDYEPTASVSVVVDQTGLYTWGSTPAMLADVQHWLNNPGLGFGWILVGKEDEKDAMLETTKPFDSKDHPDIAVRPVLTVTYAISPVPDASGRIPDGGAVPGIPLVIAKDGGDLTLSWDDSCNLTDTDYGVYGGPLPEASRDFTNHVVGVCSTGGSTSTTFAAPTGSSYFLVVPHNPVREGSYGVCTSGGSRTPTLSTCFDRKADTCR